MKDEATLLFHARDIVGESLVYDERLDALVWVDIVGRRIHRLSLDGETHDVWKTEELPTSMGLRTDGGAVVGLAHRVALWDFGGPFETLAVPEPEEPGNRLNEGCVAPDGSFWVGTMQNNVGPRGEPLPIERHSGAVYRIGPDGTCTRLTDADFGITNTMAWTADGRFLIADTLANTIYAYRHGATTHDLSERRVFAAGFERGYPDGSCMDADGYLWNCRVAGGACLARFAPDGRLDRVVDLPCSWPTSCTFGGRDFTTLFVTSARFTMDESHLAAAPQEGGLFALDVGVRGLPARRFARSPR